MSLPPRLSRRTSASSTVAGAGGRGPAGRRRERGGVGDRGRRAGRARRRSRTTRRSASPASSTIVRDWRSNTGKVSMAPASQVAWIVTCAPRGDRAGIDRAAVGGGEALSAGQRRVLVGLVRGLERARVGERGFGQIAGDALEPDRQRAARARPSPAGSSRRWRRHRARASSAGRAAAGARRDRRRGRRRWGSRSTPDRRPRRAPPRAPRQSGATTRFSDGGFGVWQSVQAVAVGSAAAAGIERRRASQRVTLAPGATSGGSAFQPTIVGARDQPRPIVERRRAAGARASATRARARGASAGAVTIRSSRPAAPAAAGRSGTPTR